MTNHVETPKLEAQQSEAVAWRYRLKVSGQHFGKWSASVKHPGYGYDVQPLYTSPTPAMRAAYAKGWHAAARWAERDDLHADVGSSAYTNERDAALAEVAKMLGDTTNGR